MRIGLLFRGDRTVDPFATAGGARLAPLMMALERLGAAVEAVVYEDEAFENVYAQLAELDGVLVWVNPIQGGATRALLDGLLLKVSSEGVWVSAHPDVVLKLGTKEVLFTTREAGWGTDTELYRDATDFRERFPKSLAKGKVRVLKQARGNGGNGVWKVALSEPPAGLGNSLGPGSLLQVQHALERDGSLVEVVELGNFLDRCEKYFIWSGCLVDQPFQERLEDGMVRCYFVHDEVVGFCRQWPRALMSPSTLAIPAAASVYEAQRPRRTHLSNAWLSASGPHA